MKVQMSYREKIISASVICFLIFILVIGVGLINQQKTDDKVKCDAQYGMENAYLKLELDELRLELLNLKASGLQLNGENRFPTTTYRVGSNLWRQHDE
ncbi:hypothetical protein WCT78_00240 [Pectobacterium versatile]|uniref:hypothetical protein n=1 Tax=Pectobacterium TaxID=122277 RepID=UPI0011AF941B|nr:MULTISPECIES: hypothetical protein [Pectobacterium]MBI0473168.1 hypothetical protein [Pectobacterium parmentieri]MBI0495781.1 hypothetical protein [Pectobacterium parmentieri]MBI0570333.1 hypothetical protein [Pectobacterium parmentieri]MBI0575023.1 hypothetical protein [Pectobacterium parmentieri]MBN3110061.1 hypothetical protein [Pectobacterium brasiliense]